MINPGIILAGQQQANPFENISQGLQMGQGLRQLLVGLATVDFFHC